MSTRLVNPVVEAYKRSIDRTLIRQNLSKTPEERILAAMQLQQLAQEVHGKARKAPCRVENR